MRNKNCTEQMMHFAKCCVHCVLEESFFVYGNSVESLKREGIVFYSYLDLNCTQVANVNSYKNEK